MPAKTIVEGSISYLWIDDSPLPYFPLRFIGAADQTRFHALISTGSKSFIMNKKIIDSLRLPYTTDPSKVSRMKSLTGYTDYEYKYAKLKFELDGQIYEHTFTILDECAECTILGMDFEPVWNYDSRDPRIQRITRSQAYNGVYTYEIN